MHPHPTSLSLSLNKRDVLGHSLICVCLKASPSNQSQRLFSSLFKWVGVSSVKSLIIYFECASQRDHEMLIASCTHSFPFSNPSRLCWGPASDDWLCLTTRWRELTDKLPFQPIAIPKQIRTQTMDLTSYWIIKSYSSCQPFKHCGLSMLRNMFLLLRSIDGVPPTCEMLRANVFWFSKNTVFKNHYSCCNVNQVS